MTTNQLSNKFYSQIGQDEYYIKNIIKYKKNGIFIDIGAHDGITISNTYYLEQNLNWTGICIEPNPSSYEKCKNNRLCKIYNKAIYEKSNQEIDFVIPCGEGYVDGGIEQLCGIKGEISKGNLCSSFVSQYSKQKIIKVNTININDLLLENNLFEIDYMSIDTEGYELKILKSLDHNKFKIKFLTVEHGCDPEYQKQIKDFMETKNYTRHRINKWDDEYILNENANVKINVNSFDIFDTLLARKVLKPIDIFKIIENKYNIPNFFENRIKAEEQSNGTFNDIYNKYLQLTGDKSLDVNYLKQIEINTELENIIPITTNINKINDNDILVSDMYLDELILKQFLEKVGINKKIKIYVSPNGKKNNTIWKELLKLYNINLHTGDNQHSDIYTANLNKINTVLTTSHKFTKLELDMPIELSNIIREFRLLNPYDENTFNYELYAEQCRSNILILSVFCCQIKYIIDKENLEQILLSIRDCCLFKKLFKYLYPNYKTITYHTSRIINQNHNQEYVEYIKSIYNNKCIIIDLNGAFKTGRELYIKAINKLPRVHLLVYNQSDTEYNGLTYSCTHQQMSNYIEKLNVDNIGKLINYENNIFIRDNPDNNIEYVNIIHTTIDNFILFLENKNFKDNFINLCNNILQNKILYNKLFSNNYFTYSYNNEIKT